MKLNKVVFALLKDNFDGTGTELVNWVPEDFKDSPAFLKNIKDPNYRQWAFNLNALWKQFGRRMTEDVEVSRDYIFLHKNTFFKMVENCSRLKCEMWKKQIFKLFPEKS